MSDTREIIADMIAEDAAAQQAAARIRLRLKKLQQTLLHLTQLQEPLKNVRLLWLKPMGILPSCWRNKMMPRLS
jgi:hypothetical protein